MCTTNASLCSMSWWCYFGKKIEPLHPIPILHYCIYVRRSTSRCHETLSNFFPFLKHETSDRIKECKRSKYPIYHSPYLSRALSCSKNVVEVTIVIAASLSLLTIHSKGKDISRLEWSRLGSSIAVLQRIAVSLLSWSEKSFDPENIPDSTQ